MTSIRETSQSEVSLNYLFLALPAVIANMLTLAPQSQNPAVLEETTGEAQTIHHTGISAAIENDPSDTSPAEVPASASTPDTDGQTFDATLLVTEEEFNSYDFDAAYVGQCLEDYALLIIAIDALKQIELMNLPPDEAIFQYAFALVEVIRRIRVPYMVVSANIEENGRMVMEWRHG